MKSDFFLKKIVVGDVFALNQAFDPPYINRDGILGILLCTLFVCPCAFRTRKMNISKIKKEQGKCHYITYASITVSTSKRGTNLLKNANDLPLQN